MESSEQNKTEENKDALIFSLYERLLQSQKEKQACDLMLERLNNRVRDLQIKLDKQKDINLEQEIELNNLTQSLIAERLNSI